MDWRPEHDNPQWPYPRGTREEHLTPALVSNARIVSLIDDRVRQYERIAYWATMEVRGLAPEGKARAVEASVHAQRYNRPWSGYP
jgi:hypothetical protein